MRRLGFLTLLAVLAALITVGAAMAQATDPTANTATTKAVVSATSNPPVVQYVWMLPDMDSNAPGIQYCTPTNNHQHDDDMVASGVQVRPNIWNRPELRQLEFFVIASDPFGPGDLTGAYVDVFHPDGSRKYELSMTRVLDGDAQGGLGLATSACSPLEAAVHTNQLSSAQASTIYTNVGFGKPWVLYRAVGDISKDQPFGPYTGFGLATAQGGATSAYLNFAFGVLPVMGMVIDFNTVNYGMIKPTVRQLVPGDRVFELDANQNPDASAYPTVMSVGNVYLNLNARFSTMVGASLGKVINRFFDIVVGTQNATALPLQRLPNQAPASQDLILAGTDVPLPGYTLESDMPTQVDFSLTAYNADATNPTSLPADAYTGTVRLWGTASAVQNPLGQ